MKYYRCEGLNAQGDLVVIGVEMPEDAFRARGPGGDFNISIQNAVTMYQVGLDVELASAERKLATARRNVDRYKLAVLKVIE